MEDKNSMFYWYPKIKNLEIPQPKTEMYKFNKEEFELIQEEKFPKTLFKNVYPIARKVGYPLFMRTDQSSCKHGWKKTCFVPNEKELESHIMELLTHSMMQGLMSYMDSGLVFRKYIPLLTKFTAFYGGFPVNRERRYFIKNGKVQCHHSYWYPKAIENPSIENWEPILSFLNRERKEEIQLLTKYAELVGSVFKDYWSVDFAYGKDGKWYLIDMAEGERSFHWLECKYCPKKMKEQYEKKGKRETTKEQEKFLEEMLEFEDDKNEKS